MGAHTWSLRVGQCVRKCTDPAAAMWPARFGSAPPTKPPSCVRRADVAEREPKEPVAFIRGGQRNPCQQRQNHPPGTKKVALVTTPLDDIFTIPRAAAARFRLSSVLAIQ